MCCPFCADSPREGSVATHYAPEIATMWPTPMLEWSGTGILCLNWFLWLVARLSGVPRNASWKAVPRSVVVALTSCIAVGYVWFAVSGIIALTGTTLLPFRVESLIVVTCYIGGVCAVSDGWIYLRSVIRTSQINQGEFFFGGGTNSDESLSAQWHGTARLRGRLCGSYCAVDDSELHQRTPGDGRFRPWNGWVTLGVTGRD